MTDCASRLATRPSADASPAECREGSFHGLPGGKLIAHAGEGDGLKRAGTSLVEVVVAVAILGIGIAGVASLTAAAARTLVRARSLDEAHMLLQSFVDSAVAAPVRGPESGRRVHPQGVLDWMVPSTPGSDAWVRFAHRGLSAPVRIEFVVPALPVSPRRRRAP